jgi:hypothetical protein
MWVLFLPVFFFFLNLFKKKKKKKKESWFFMSLEELDVEVEERAIHWEYMCMLCFYREHNVAPATSFLKLFEQTKIKPYSL